MSRRLAAAAVALALLGLVSAGALGGVFASDTTGSGLVIDDADGPNGDYADLSNDRLQLDLSEGGGISNDAVTRLDAVFVVTNDRSYAAPVWVSDNSSGVGFYDTETGASVDSRKNARNLSSGESLVVGVAVDTRDSSVENVESTSTFVVETVVKDTTETESGGSTETSETAGTDSSTDSTTPDGGSTIDGSGTDTGANGGGRQPSSGGSESSYTVYNTTSGATVRVSEGVASDPFSPDLTGDGGQGYASGADTDVTGSEFHLTFDRDGWRVEVTDPTAEPQQAPSVDGDAVSYFRVDAYQVEATSFDHIGVNASVPLPDGAEPAAVTFYRYAGDGWQRVETTHHGGDLFGADLGGFGEVAVVIDPSSGDGAGDGTGDGTSDGTTDGDSTATQSGSDSGTSGTVAETPTTTDGSKESAESGITETATAVERLQDPLRLNQGLGPVTIFVLAVFSVWLAARKRVRRGGNGGGGL